MPTSEILLLAVGELIVSLIVSGVYLLLNRFSYAVISGCLLGSAVTVFNFVFLSVFQKTKNTFVHEKQNVIITHSVNMMLIFFKKSEGGIFVSNGFV